MKRQRLGCPVRTAAPGPGFAAYITEVALSGSKWKVRETRATAFSSSVPLPLPQEPQPPGVARTQRAGPCRMQRPAWHTEMGSDTQGRSFLGGFLVKTSSLALDSEPVTPGVSWRATRRPQSPAPGAGCTEEPARRCTARGRAGQGRRRVTGERGPFRSREETVASPSEPHSKRLHLGKPHAVPRPQLDPRDGCARPP